MLLVFMIFIKELTNQILLPRNRAIACAQLKGLGTRLSIALLFASTICQNRKQHAWMSVLIGRAGASPLVVQLRLFFYIFIYLFISVSYVVP